jgi:hypothetical protein
MAAILYFISSSISLSLVTVVPRYLGLLTSSIFCGHVRILIIRLNVTTHTSEGNEGVWAVAVTPAGQEVTMHTGSIYTLIGLHTYLFIYINNI